MGGRREAGWWAPPRRRRTGFPGLLTHPTSPLGHSVAAPPPAPPPPSGQEGGAGPVEAAPPGRAFRETRPSPLLAAHWPDRVVCPHPAPTPSCREAGKGARCRPQRRWGQWAGHELALNVLVTLSQTKPSVSALTRELHSLSKCGLSSYDAPGPRDTGTGAWPEPGPQSPAAREHCPPRRETAVPPVHVVPRAGKGGAPG